jgi:inositol transport system substrate-binding protein
MKKKQKTKNKESKNQTISILFSTYTDFVSRLVGLFSGFGSTHVSISLDNEDEYFYAFNTKGFRKEYPKKHKNRTKTNTCLRLQITDRQYNILKNRIKKFEKKRKQYSYDYWGVFLCMIRLHRQTKKKYFCSSFMAELLEKARIVELKKKNTRYLPAQLQRELMLCPLIIGVAQNIFIK